MACYSISAISCSNSVAALLSSAGAARGRQRTFYLDLLFYHVRLHAYFVIELKTGKFKPEYAGKLNFYLSAADELIRIPPDGPTLGLLRCDRHGVIVEYALRDIAKPVGVST